jgi:TRAP-type C4-dicarboxylate transport system permease small subunit
VIPGAAPTNPIDLQISQLKANIDNKLNGGNKQLKAMLDGMIDRAQGEEQKVRAELSKWFDNGMDRIGGLYKRWSQIVSFVFALLISIALNISAVDVATALWNHSADTSAIAGIKQADLPAVLEVLDKLHAGTALPIGWPHAATATPATLISGWIITAFAALFGAPFWFDLLQQIIRLKGTGPSPGEKADNKGAAA